MMRESNTTPHVALSTEAIEFGTSEQQAYPSERLQEMLASGVNVEWDPHANYGISAPSAEPKFSEGFFCCGGFLLTGLTKEGKRISMLTHQNLALAVRDAAYESGFVRELYEKVSLFSEMVDPESIRAFSFGGSMRKTSDGKVLDQFSSTDNRETLTRLVQEIVHEIVGIEPTVIQLAFPRVDSGGYGESMYAYDTENDRFFVVHKKDSVHHIQPVPVDDLRRAIQNFNQRTP